MESIYNFLKKLNIKKEEKLIVAVSFGPDSMALLDILNKYYSDNEIICAHVHHNHRKESDMECINLKEFCDKNNITFEMMKIDRYTNNKFTEEEARNKRYEFFEELIKKYNSNYLFTAHHGDDLIETVLMRLVRGSSLKGYSGIPLISKRDNYNLIRPLLYLTKDNIIKYCDENKISFAVDKSNEDEVYTRNRFRKNVLPLLKEENPNIHLKFLKFSTELLESEELLKSYQQENYKKIVINNVINIITLKKESELMIKRIIKEYLLNYYKDDICLIDDSHLSSILNLINSNNTSGSIDLPNKNKLIKSYNQLYFDKEKEYNDYCFALNEKVKLPNGYVIEIVENLENTTNYFTCFNKGDISFPLKVRNVKPGDKISVLGMNGSKKVNDIFITEKVPKQDRLEYPVLTNSNDEIIWLPGLKKSKYDKSKQEKYDIIIKYYKED